MIDSRSRGLSKILAFLVLLFLPLSFILWAILGVELTERIVHQLINYPLYLSGVVVASIVYFSFYSSLKFTFSSLDLRHAFRLTCTQVLILSLVLFGIVFATKDKSISRLFLGSYLLFSACILFAINAFLPASLARIIFRGRNLRACLLIGDNESADDLKKWVNDNAFLGLQIVGMLDTGRTNQKKASAFRMLGKVKDLKNVIRAEKINQVILLELEQGKEWVRSIFQICEEEGCRLLVYNPWRRYFDRPLISISEGHHAFFALEQEPLEDPINRIIKRLFDYAIALPVVVFVIPFLTIFVYIGQRIQSPGPIFHVQVRSGFNRRKFCLYKFRTMHVESEADQVSNQSERVFSFGRFLRRTSLDEFPQFINVLLGHMSVVGPRPHLIEHDDIFSSYVRVYRQRHFVRPGLTGLAQIKGFRGEISDIDVLKKRIFYDLQYINEWSLGADIEIVFRTLIQIFNPPGAAY